MATKICKKCGEEKDLTHFRKNAQVKDGHSNKCRDCMCELTPVQKQEIKDREALFEKGLKKCSKCNEIKELSAFHIQRGAKDGHKSWCRSCNQIYEYGGERGVLRKKKKLEWERRPEVKKRLSIKRANNEEYKKARKKYYNSERGREWRREYENRFQRRVSSNIRTRIYTSLRTQNAKKQAEFDEYLGCSISFFRDYIESLFIEGMSWDNYGRGHDKWHIDHIIPCAAFDFSDIEQQKKCFHYTNQQPLWESDNFRKSSNLNGVHLFHKKE